MNVVSSSFLSGENHMSNKRCNEEYKRRIHKVQDYIEGHLDQTISIEELSIVAGFSKYHFSRIFQGKNSNFNISETFL